MKGLVDGFSMLKDLPLAEWKVADEKNLESFDFPVFLKADISGHKTEVGAVVKCENVSQAKKNFKMLCKKFPSEKIILQKSYSGIEMMIGVKEDKVFGKVLVVGFGGIFSEEIKIISFRALPVARSDVVKMLKESGANKFFSARGKNYPIEKFVTLVEKIAYLSEKFDIKELDLNPVIVDEKDAHIVDIRIDY